jgi:signal transduction histidine kinase
MQGESGYANYRYGINLRVGTAILIEAIAAAAYFAGVIRVENLIGISASLSFITLQCIPFWFIMKGAIEAGRPRIATLADRLFLLIGFSGVIYSLGGIEATYLIPIYIIVMIYYVVATDRKMPYVTATMSLACFSLVVLLELFGVLPHLGLSASSKPLMQVAILVVTAVILYVSAFTSSYAERIIARGQAELKAQNVELEKARDRALESDKLKSEFMAHMSHELRTPLHHIIGFTELVLEQTDDRLGEPQREELRDVLKSGTHLLSLINEVLDYSRGESGRLELEEDDVDLAALLKDSLKVITDSATKGSVRVEMTLGNIPAYLRLDERKMKQILYNLLSNAVKFTPPGGKVVLDARTAEPSLLLVSVSDTGIGLAGEDLERVFLPFESVHNKKKAKYPGTGLGLSIARKYVALHGGRIWAESAGKDQGSTFRFSIPLAELQNGE